VPQKRSGGYAVLLTLYRQTQVHSSPVKLAETPQSAVASNQTECVLLLSSLSP